MEEFDHIGACTARGWDIAASLIASLSSALSPTRTFTGVARREALALLRVAEAMVRRILLLLAGQLKPAKPRDAQTLPDFTLMTRQTEPAPMFCLTEAQASWPQISANSGPRIRLLDDALLSQPSTAAPDPTDPNARFWQRLTALNHVLSHRRKHLGRMARWLAAAHARQGPARRFPIRLGRPPGYSRARRKADPISQSSLMDLSTFAWQSFAPP